MIGLSTLYPIDAIASTATLWAVLKLPAIAPTGEARRAGIRQVLEGFRYLATQKVLLASFVVDIIAMVFDMPRALFPQIADDTFGDPATRGSRSVSCSPRCRCCRRWPPTRCAAAGGGVLVVVGVAVAAIGFPALMRYKVRPEKAFPCATA